MTFTYRSLSGDAEVPEGANCKLHGLNTQRDARVLTV
jgi:hypothetical protein